MNMIIFVCLDDNNGMMFNNRRQSMDVSVRKRILSIVKNKKLWMSEYTKKQFTEECNVCADISQAEYAFIENPNDMGDIVPEQIIVYRWNRKYPADVYFDLGERILKESTEFKGKSHEIITEEIYI